MAYLDENGIPREPEGTKLYNSEINEVIDRFSTIGAELRCTKGSLPECMQDDSEIDQAIGEICRLLQECEKRCHYYYIY